MVTYTALSGHQLSKHLLKHLIQHPAVSQWVVFMPSVCLYKLPFIRDIVDYTQDGIEQVLYYYSIVSSQKLHKTTNH